MKYNQTNVEQRIATFMSRKSRQFKGLDSYFDKNVKVRSSNQVRLPLSDITIPATRLKIVGA